MISENSSYNIFGNQIKLSISDTNLVRKCFENEFAFFHIFFLNKYSIYNGQKLNNKNAITNIQSITYINSFCMCADELFVRSQYLLSKNTLYA